MKKEKAIELIKAGTHAIEMDCKSEKSIELLRSITESPFLGLYKYYSYTHCDNSTNLIPIKITSITESEDFKNDENVCGMHKDGTYKICRFIGIKKSGEYLCEDDAGFVLHFKEIRKLNPERNKAIETCKELMEKFNIKTEEL